MLNCNMMNVPFKYLGMKVSGNHQRVYFWDNVVAKIQQRLDRWKGKFLSMAGSDWGKDGKKVAWVTWEKVCNSKEKGGLDIKDIRRFNDALLGKWIWRLQSAEGGMWKEIIKSKYDDLRVLRGAESNSKESIWWKDLKKVWASEEWGSNFEDNIDWRLGDGN
ncbi:uncharacterized protein [Phaseolus vulgaris]|uniref:uncharacterized protein n=1 Tax=Phaseolus vulgaris TaxID=3885 RepID=UPI0035CC3F99